MTLEAENADLLRQAIAADNLSFVEACVEDGDLVASVEAESLGSLLATLDDLLVNLKVADEVLCGHGTIVGKED